MYGAADGHDNEAEINKMVLHADKEFGHTPRATRDEQRRRRGAALLPGLA
jgi:hypothetical protein